MYTPGYIPGDRKVTCAVCDFSWRRSEMRKGVAGSQKGLDVCPKCFDSVHPNEARVKPKVEGKLVDIR